MNKKNQKGFTLVELIVVIAIVAILAAVGIVGYSQFIKNARDTKAKAELDQVVNVLYAEAVADGIYLRGSGENPTSWTVVEDAVVEEDVKAVTVENGKLKFDDDLTAPQLEALIVKYANDFTGKFILEKDLLSYEAADGGKGKTIVIGGPEAAVDYQKGA